MLPEFGRCGELFHTPSGTAYADIPLKTTGKPSPYAATVSQLIAGGPYEATGEAASALGARSDGPERAVPRSIACRRRCDMDCARCFSAVFTASEPFGEPLQGCRKGLGGRAE
jgi:hypothetical protein